jgi:Zn-dependent M28 family amino/carboxypeptidase
MWRVRISVTVLGIAASCGDGSGDVQKAGPSAPSASCDAVCGSSIAAAVSRDRWTADLATVAQPRPPASPGWQAAQDLCATRLSAAGFNVERHAYGSGINVVGVLASGAPGPRVVVSAHYDHIEGCQGADDNASGIAGVLEAARVLGAARVAGTLVVACWDEEERGLIGSRAYAEREKSRGNTIDAAFVMDMIGYKSSVPGSQKVPAGFDTLFPSEGADLAAKGYVGDFVAVIHDSGAHPEAETFAAQAALSGVPAVSLEIPNAILGSAAVADFRRSDHASFWSAGTPALMVTDTAEQRNPHYHCTGAPDAPSDLDAEFATRVVRAQVGAIAVVLGTR